MSSTIQPFSTIINCTLNSKINCLMKFAISVPVDQLFGQTECYRNISDPTEDLNAKRNVLAIVCVADTSDPPFLISQCVYFSFDLLVWLAESFCCKT